MLIYMFATYLKTLNRLTENPYKQGVSTTFSVVTNLGIKSV